MKLLIAVLLKKIGDFVNKSFQMYSSLLRDMRWEVRVSRMGETRNAYKI
jgi:hypothetical protein